MIDQFIPANMEATLEDLRYLIDFELLRLADDEYSFETGLV